MWIEQLFPSPMTSELQLTLPAACPHAKEYQGAWEVLRLAYLAKLVFFLVLIGKLDWWKNNILVEDLNTSDEVTIYFADEVHLGL